MVLPDDVEGVAETAADVARRLRERGWTGDSELADQLESRLGTVPTPDLRPLTIDLEELAMVLEGDPLSGGGRIDLRNGDVLSDPPSSTWSRSARRTMRTRPRTGG